VKDVPLVHVCLIAKECQREIEELRAKVAELEAKAAETKAPAPPPSVAPDCP
jgi:BMFP domain-containing protein YqiC